MDIKAKATKIVERLITEQDGATPELDDFVHGYLVCALWSTNDDSDPQGGDPLNANYGIEDIAQKCVEKIQADCARFQTENSDALDVFYKTAHSNDGSSVQVLAGHDFCLSRNRHGSGFFDESDVPDVVQDKLQDAAEAMGELDLYVGDDGKIYCQ